MKKFLALLLVVCLMVPVTVFATEGEEIPEPTISDISIVDEKDSYQGGDEIVVKMKVDSDYPINSVWLNLMPRNGEGWYGGVQSSEMKDDYLYVSFSIYGTMTEGIWDVPSVNLGNNELGYSSSKTIENLSFVVDNSNYKIPKINSLSVTPIEGHSKETEFVFEADVEEGSVEVPGFTVILSPEYGQDVHVGMNKVSEGKYRGVGDFSEAKDNVYYFKMAAIYTEDGSHFFYAKEDLNYGDGPTIIFEPDFEFVTLTNVVKDVDKPILVDFSFEKAVVNTPGTLKLNVTVKDPTTFVYGIKYVLVNTETGEKIESDGTYVSDENKPNIEETFEFKVDFSRYTESTSYYLESIQFTDAVGNQSCYSIDAATQDERIEKKVVDIINNNISDVTLSLNDSKLCEKIGELEEGAIAVIDVSGETRVPAEFFRTIKGKDITIIFEQLYYSIQAGNSGAPTGIQWIMNGKDVRAQHIDDDGIDVNIEVGIGSTDTKWYLYQKKKYGKELPEFFDDEPEWLSNHIKETLVEEGFGDLIPNIESYSKPGEYFCYTYGRLRYAKEYLELIFEDNGKLPAKSTIRIKPDYAFRNMLGVEDLYLHYIHPEHRVFELIQSGIFMDSEGCYEFQIEHNSSYALNNGLYEVEEEDNPTIPDNTKPEDNKTNNTTNTETGKAESKVVKTGDTNNTFLYATLLLAAVVLTASTLVYKKRTK